MVMKRKRSATKTRRSYRKQRISRNVVKKTINSLSETKRCYSDSSFGVDMLLSPMCYSPLYDVPIGSGKGQRIGNKIYVKGIDCRLKLVPLGPKTDSAVFGKIYLFWTREDTTNPLGGTWQFNGSTSPYFRSADNLLASFIDTDSVKLVGSKKFYQPANAIAGFDSALYVNKYFRVNKNYEYDRSGLGKYGNYVVVLVMEQQGAVVANLHWTMVSRVQVIYKDI